MTKIVVRLLISLGAGLLCDAVVALVAVISDHFLQSLYHFLWTFAGGIAIIVFLSLTLIDRTEEKTQQTRDTTTRAA